MTGHPVTNLSKFATLPNAHKPPPSSSFTISYYLYLLSTTLLLLLLCTNMTTIDPRRVEGGKVHALAHHVTSESECNRRYGSNAKTKKVNERVIQVRNTPTSTGRTSTLVEALYKLDVATTKQCWLNIRSVKKDWVEGPNFHADITQAQTPQNGSPDGAMSTFAGRIDTSSTSTCYLYT